MFDLVKMLFEMFDVAFSQYCSLDVLRCCGRGLVVVVAED
jgi:hypothetical protein